MNMRLSEAVTSGFILWGAVLEGHYHQNPLGAGLFLLGGAFWLGFLEFLEVTRRLRCPTPRS